jgi:hypothetical protein
VEKIIFKDEIIAFAPGTSEFEEAHLTLQDGRAVLLALGSLVDSIEKAIAA